MIGARTPSHDPRSYPPSFWMGEGPVDVLGATSEASPETSSVAPRGRPPLVAPGGARILMGPGLRPPAAPPRGGPVGQAAATARREALVVPAAASAEERQPVGWLRRLGTFVVAWWRRQRRERAIARAVGRLQQFDDRELRDIGIHHRLQIEPFVRHGIRFRDGA